jgi:pantetheine-phosphate adenylyltransferase
MAITNKQLYPDFEVVFFMSSIRHSHLSSSIVKEIIHFNGDVRLFVPEQIAEYLEKRK